MSQEPSPDKHDTRSIERQIMECPLTNEDAYGLLKSLQRQIGSATPRTTPFDRVPHGVVSQEDVTAFVRSLDAKGTPWSDGCSAVLEMLWAEVTTLRSSTAFVPEGERKSLAGQAIEMAISALRDIQRRAPGTRTFFDYEAFIERELVPAMAMADKDRQGCIGLMGLLAKEKLKAEELSKPVSATALSEPWPIKLPVTYSERHHCIIGADGINVFALHLRMSVVDGHAIARIINREQFDIEQSRG